MDRSKQHNAAQLYPINIAASFRDFDAMNIQQPINPTAELTRPRG